MAEPEFLTTTRAFYDAVAADYDDHFGDTLAARALDRAVLAGFAELVRAAGGGPVADVGCGPGRVTAHLHDLGLSVRGIDLSPQMVALARRTHPGLRFDEGSMTALDVPDGSLGGLVLRHPPARGAAARRPRRVPPGAGTGRQPPARLPGR